jgi:PHD/YefM family antitoxin component YafN of YafNO toxin-antitoxin module/mRNA-degrading endonuclease RelE of RelBE toxin-antitoxin system
MTDKQLELLDLSTDVREIVGECELTGRRTTFVRDGRAVAILISHDEYTALRETLDLANDEVLRARIARADAEIGRGAALELDDLDVRAKRTSNDRLRFAESVEAEWKSLATHEQETMMRALLAIDDDPIAGAPLFDPLRGLWSLRVEHLRIVYRIVAEARFIGVLAIARVAPV